MHTHTHTSINGKVILASITLGIILGILDIQPIYTISDYAVKIIMNLLKFVSLPMIFLSLTATITKLDDQKSFKIIFSKTLKYTLLTTVIAAIIAMILYIVVEPAQNNNLIATAETLSATQDGMAKYLVGFIPDNLVKAFADNNIMAVVLAALIIGMASLQLEKEKRQYVNKVFDSFFALFMQIATNIINILPYTLWAFMVLFVYDIKKGFAIESLIYYIAIVIAANFIQAAITLPVFLKLKGISPIATVKGMYPALLTAFFSKSSSATMPTTIHCAEKRLKISKKISSISIPLCTTINMNACAAFIYITVIYVSQSYGVTFTYVDYLIWLGLATIAAIGNAGVPMGCFFMSSAYLTNLDIPIYLMGVILPFYTILDMFETAINVWSDACVTKVVDHELKDNAHLKKAKS